MEPYELSIKEASNLMKKKELSPVELVNSCIDRIQALDEKLFAWALLDKEGALRMAMIGIGRRKNLVLVTRGFNPSFISFGPSELTEDSVISYI